MTEQADLLRAETRSREALDLIRKALALFDKAGARPDERSQVVGLQGRLELELGQTEAAVKDLQAGIAAQASIGGPQNMERNYMQSDLGEAYLALGRAPEALKLLEPSLGLMRAHKTPGLVRARTAFALARALEKSGGDLTRARALARDSLPGTAAGPEEARVLSAAVRKWLDAHPGP
jgi:tetratricopeptide (TPR) repeat protein